MATFDFGSWPPSLTKEQLEALTLTTTTYALGHGLLYLPPAIKQPRVPSAAIHAPVSLFPAPFPRKLFEQAKRIQRTYNVLYARIAQDNEFLDRVMGAEVGVGKADDFIGRLWRGWKSIREEGMVQPLHLGLFRSDYLLHGTGEEYAIKQVEFNTISVSFGCLSQRTAELHRYLLTSTDYYGVSPVLKKENFPANDNIRGMAEGLAAGHLAYGTPSAWILFVVQPGERNVFDQRPVEWELLERHGIHSIRQTFDELEVSAVIDPATRVLRIKTATNGLVEISTIYYRSAYTPADFLTPKHYDIRILLERSKAINCPSIPLQLAGGKKVQEVLTHPGILESFLSDEKYGAPFGEEDITELRSSFMAMWALALQDGTTASGEEPVGVKQAREKALSLVLKPQREGGGNNVYKEDIPRFLDNLAAEEREAWVAMELIKPPPGAGNYLIRAGSTELENQTPVQTEVISEIGIFGWALFGGETKAVKEREVGWLVRTKGKDSNEGGVATGFSVLDSLLLVN